MADKQYVDELVVKAVSYDIRDTNAQERIATIEDTLKTKANITDVYTKTEHDAQVAGEIAKIIADAPASLDTLKEIADWIQGHPDQVSTINTAIAGKCNNYNNNADWAPAANYANNAGAVGGISFSIV